MSISNLYTSTDKNERLANRALDKVGPEGLAGAFNSQNIRLGNSLYHLPHTFTGFGGMDIPDNEGAYAKGGIIKGKGTGTSDSIGAKLPVGGAIIPADVVKMYGKAYFDKMEAAAPKAKGAREKVEAKVSNGEFRLSPEAVKFWGQEAINNIINSDNENTEQPGMMDEAESMPPKLGLQGYAQGGVVRNYAGGGITDIDTVGKVPVSNAPTLNPGQFYSDTGVKQYKLATTETGPSTNTNIDKVGKAGPGKNLTLIEGENLKSVPKPIPYEGIPARPVSTSGIVRRGLSAAANNAGRIAGGALTVGPEALGVYRDVAGDNLTPQEKALRVTEGATRVGAALAGGEAGASLGALGGPFAPVTVPLGAIAGGLAGYAAPDLANKAINYVTGSNNELPSVKASRLRLDTPDQQRVADVTAAHANDPSRAPTDAEYIDDNGGLVSKTGKVYPQYQAIFASPENTAKASELINPPRLGANQDTQQPQVNQSQATPPALARNILGEPVQTLDNAGFYQQNFGNGQSAKILPWKATSDDALQRTLTKEQYLAAHVPNLGASQNNESDNATTLATNAATVGADKYKADLLSDAGKATLAEDARQFDKGGTRNISRTKYERDDDGNLVPVFGKEADENYAAQQQAQEQNTLFENAFDMTETNRNPNHPAFGYAEEIQKTPAYRQWLAAKKSKK